MADVFADSKCVIAPVERIPPGNLLTDTSVPPAPPDIPDCPDQIVVAPPQDPPCPSLSTGATAPAVWACDGPNQVTLSITPTDPCGYILNADLQLDGNQLRSYVGRVLGQVGDNALLWRVVIYPNGPPPEDTDPANKFVVDVHVLGDVGREAPIGSLISPVLEVVVPPGSSLSLSESGSVSISEGAGDTTVDRYDFCRYRYFYQDVACPSLVSVVTDKPILQIQPALGPEPDPSPVGGVSLIITPHENGAHVFDLDLVIPCNNLTTSTVNKPLQLLDWPPSGSASLSESTDESGSLPGSDEPHVTLEITPEPNCTFKLDIEVAVPCFKLEPNLVPNPNPDYTYGIAKSHLIIDKAGGCHWFGMVGITPKSPMAFGTLSSAATPATYSGHTITAPGHATGRIFDYNGSGMVPSTMPDTTGIPVLNMLPNTIANGATVVFGTDGKNWWIIGTAFCSDIS